MPLTPEDVQASYKTMLNPDRGAVRGCIVDFVGSVTECRFIASLSSAAGQVEGIPRPANFHSKYGEWIGCLRSVAEAKDEFVMAELGAGWGPWLASCGVAARQRRIGDIRLTGIEAAAGHFDFLLRHLRTTPLITICARGS